MVEPADRLAGREIILELIDYGELVRVTAVDAETGLEATATGPRTAARSDLEKIALRKLARRVFGPPSPDGPPTRRRGRSA
jgi:hypothetical protein